MKYTYLTLFFLLIFHFSADAQTSAGGHFLVEFDKFSPPTKDIVKSFEGYIAEPFLANDVAGNEHFLGDYKGKKVILWFWSIHNAVALEQASAMKLLQERNADGLKIIAFAKEKKAEVEEYLRQNPLEVDVIPNGEIFAQMAYGGGDLGSPRMFIIDEDGIIKVVLPEEAFADNSKLLVSLESILGGL